jgi:hypothetical protein
MDMFSLKLRKPEPPLFTTVGVFLFQAGSGTEAVC